MMFWSWFIPPGTVFLGVGYGVLAVWPQLTPPPALDLSDAALAEFVGPKWNDVEFPREWP